MNNLKIKTRILILSLLSAIALTAFAGFELSSKWQISSEMEALNELASLGPVIGATVHELQKERGRSAGFIGSEGKRFASELPQQRLLTDEKYKALDEALENFDAVPYGTTLVGKIALAERALGQLAGSRSRITGLNMSVGEMAKYYTSTIARLLGVIEEMGVLSSNDQVTKLITSYTSFLQAKERNGIERAMGANGFGAGKFSPAVYQRFIGLIAEQKSFMSVFQNYASRENRDYYEATVTGGPVNKVASYREIVIASPQTNDLKGVEASQWFNAITNKINLLKKVEDRLAEDVFALTAEATNSANTALVTVSITAVALILTVMGLSVYIGQSISGPVAKMTEAMQRLAEGDTDCDIPCVGRSDEIGSMADTVQIFKEGQIENMRLAEEQKKAEAERAERTAMIEKMMEEQQKEQEEKDRRATAITGLTSEFERDAAEMMGAVSAAANELQATAESMSATAEETSAQSANVAAAAEQATTNVQTIASATEQLSGSISEIGRRAEESAEIASSAATEAERTNKIITGLNESAQSVGDIVSLINDIAGQTNLLALNATIEASRAGDAGKGFAVVASEVKTLASQTASATEEISSQISSMQVETANAVKALDGFGDIVKKIDSTATSIASAVQEQDAATSEISRNVQDVASGTGEVSSNIAGVSDGAAETGNAASGVLSAAGELAQQSDAMQEKIRKFLEDVQAA